MKEAMNILKNLFDDFILHTRIMPTLISVIPIYIYLLLKNIIDDNFIENVIINGFIGVLFIAIFYRIIRNLGKEYEKKMYKELGAKPTTIVLRYSNGLIDDITKTRYHKKLNNKIYSINLPIKRENETEDDDIKYESAINWLRNYANTHRETEQRTYQELKEYNFWRNLYGAKKIIILSCLIMIVIEIFLLGLKSFIDIMEGSYKKFMTLFIICIMLTISCISIKKKNVEEKAFDYAVTLLEVCERL